ncbi:MAG: hypothetical protein MJ085_02610 [Clostridia bacterium]|nr:hypothetical protein [Clostridia bacterium]
MQEPITVMSFGFLYGVPQDADTVIDTRGMKNPFYEPSLRDKTGLDPEVQAYVLSEETGRAYLASILEMLRLRLALYERWDSPNKKPLMIAVGCSGGRHRSVTVALRVRQALEQWGCSVKLIHRELE